MKGADLECARKAYFDHARMLLLATLLGGVAIWAAIMTISLSSPWRERAVVVAVVAGVALSAWLASLILLFLARGGRSLLYRLAVALVANHESRVRSFPYRGKVEGGPNGGEPTVLICLKFPQGASELAGVKCQAKDLRSTSTSRALLRIPDGLVAFFPQDFGLSEPSLTWYRFVWSANDEVVATMRLRFDRDMSYREARIARLGSWIVEWAQERSDRL